MGVVSFISAKVEGGKCLVVDRDLQLDVFFGCYRLYENTGKCCRVFDTETWVKLLCACNEVFNVYKLKWHGIFRRGVWS
jgi:hypothetical protein